jgi:hypothetical protein
MGYSRTYFTNALILIHLSTYDSVKKLMKYKRISLKTAEATKPVQLI